MQLSDFASKGRKKNSTSFISSSFNGFFGVAARQAVWRWTITIRIRISSRKMLDMIAKELLEILVCPACKQTLQYRKSPESLKCTQCRRVYAVKDDIPIMLIDEATVEE